MVARRKLMCAISSLAISSAYSRKAEVAKGTCGLALTVTSPCVPEPVRGIPKSARDFPYAPKV